MSGTPEAREGLGALGRDVAMDAARLVRAEIDLAKAEMMAAMKRMLLAAVFGVMAAVLLLIAFIEALGALPSEFGPSLFHSRYWGWLILGALLALLAGVFAVLALGAVRRSLRQGKRVVQDLKEDGQWLKRLSRRAKSAS